MSLMKRIRAGALIVLAAFSLAAAAAVVYDVNGNPVEQPDLDREALEKLGITGSMADAAMGNNKVTVTTPSVDQPSLGKSDMLNMGVAPDVADAATNGASLSGEQEWICKCFLCLASPNGWKSTSECHPPVKELFRKLRKRHWKPPRCKSAGGSNYMVTLYNPVDPCSKMGLNDFSGYLAVSTGSTASRALGLFKKKKSSSTRYLYSSAYEGKGTQYCVGNYVRKYTACVSYDAEGYCNEYATIHVFDEVAENPQFSPYAIDVYVEGAYWHRTRE